METKFQPVLIRNTNSETHNNQINRHVNKTFSNSDWGYKGNKWQDVVESGRRGHLYDLHKGFSQETLFVPRTHDDWESIVAWGERRAFHTLAKQCQVSEVRKGFVCWRIRKENRVSGDDEVHRLFKGSKDIELILMFPKGIEKPTRKQCVFFNCCIRCLWQMCEEWVVREKE